jgi:hypothetical protein
LNEGSRKGSYASGGRGAPFGSIDDNDEDDENDYHHQHVDDYGNEMSSHNEDEEDDHEYGH